VEALEGGTVPTLGVANEPATVERIDLVLSVGVDCPGAELFC